MVRKQAQETDGVISIKDDGISSDKKKAGIITRGGPTWWEVGDSKDNGMD